MRWRIAFRLGALLVALKWRREAAGEGRGGRTPPRLSTRLSEQAGDVEDALNMMARLIYERTYLRSWRQADFWVRSQALQTARALLEGLDGQAALRPDFADDLRGLASGARGYGRPCDPTGGLAARHRRFPSGAGAIDTGFSKTKPLAAQPVPAPPAGTPAPAPARRAEPGASSFREPFGPKGCPAE